MAPMLWELLVTDGHVRAARLRYLAPWSIGAGVLLIAIGWYVLNTIPPSQRFNSSSEGVLQQRANQARQPSLNAFTRVPNLYVSPNEIQQLVPESALPDVYNAVVEGMAKGSLPKDLTVKEAKSPAEFWSWNWPHDELISLDQGDLRAFGAIVFAKGQPAQYGQQNTSHPVRWLAIFRRFSTGWDNVAIRANGFTSPPGEKTVDPIDIPLSLRKLMDMSADLQ